MSGDQEERFGKVIHDYAELVHDQLHGACLLYAAENWEEKIPEEQFSAWACLYAWRLAGEPLASITSADEAIIRNYPLPPDLSLAEAPVRHEAMGFHLPEGWVVLARHAPPPVAIAVVEGAGWIYGRPRLTYLCRIFGFTHAGCLRLHETHTPADITLLPAVMMDPVSEKKYDWGPGVNACYELRLRQALTKFYW